MVKLALGTDNIYPVNPNLTLSTDDPTIFVFEGTTSETGKKDWEWKLVDKGSSNSGLRSEF